MRRYNRELGQTFVLVTHDPEVAHACDRVIRMRDGRVRDVSAVLSATPVDIGNVGTVGAAGAA